ncbi:unnamed protein product [Urochloa humidicola]
MAAASPAAILAFLARPLSLLRNVADGCAGYLGSLASRLKPATATATAAACQTQQEEGNVDTAAVVTEEVVVVEIRSRGTQQARGLREAKGGRGGDIHNVPK